MTTQIESNTPPHVVVVGGGFGGLESAFYLRMRLGMRVRITLVSDKDHFLFKPNTINIPFGKDPGEFVLPLREATATKDIEFVQARATGVEPHTKKIHTTSGPIEYDFLMLATGATMRPEEILGLQEHANTIWTMEEPSARIVRDEVETHTTHMRGDDDRVFQHVVHAEEVPVQVHGVDRHALVHHAHADPLPFVNLQRVGVRVGLPVDRPSRIHHPARQREVKRAVRRHVFSRLQRAQIGQLQHAATAQPFGHGTLRPALRCVCVTQHRHRWRRAAFHSRGHNGPCARIVGLDDHVVPLSHADIQRIDQVRRDRAPIGVRNGYPMTGNRQTKRRRS